VAPPSLAAPAPELSRWLVPAWEAFSILSGDRQIGAMGGAGPIPFTSIDRYAAREGIEGEDFDELLHFLRHLDGIYLKWAAAEAEKRAKAAKAKGRQ